MYRIETSYALVHKLTTCWSFSLLIHSFECELTDSPTMCPWINTNFRHIYGSRSCFFQALEIIYVAEWGWHFFCSRSKQRFKHLREKHRASCVHPMFLAFSMWQYFSSTPFLVATTILTWFKWRLASVQPLCPFILFGHPFLPTNVPWFKNKTVNLDLLPPKTRLPGAGFIRKNPKSPRSIWRWYMHRFLLLFLRADLVRGWSCRQRETARRHQQHHWQ